MTIRSKRGKSALNLIAGAGFVFSLMATPVAQAKDITLNMAAPDWFPTRTLQALADNYKSPTGNNVKIVLDFIPWGSYYERLAASLTSGEKKYDMAVSDSQWLGAFIEGGYYLKLNKYIDKDPELKRLIADTHPNLLKAYATYPYGSDNIYGFPQMPDTMVAYYRKDLYCNDGEQAAFKAKYNYKLACSYEEMSNLDWKQVMDIARFFTRKAGDKLAGEVLKDDFYGIAMNYSKVYDFMTMMATPFMWQWGGGIWDETGQPDAKVMGVVNSDANKKALEAFVSFVPYNPPGAVNQGIDEINNAFAQGHVAYAANWAAVGSPILDPKTSVVADKFAVAQMPGKRKADGSLSRYWNVGGQPFVLTTWNNEEVVGEALNFVKWWLSEKTQIAFAKAGGSVGLVSLHSRPEYNTYKPWNRAFVDSLGYQKDIWHVPEFFELLTQQQEKLNAVVAGQITASEALDAIAKHQDTVLREAGRLK
jgi:multiple sugar transport system substrate-binding protein